MSYRLPPLSALRAFEAVARHASFKKAAAELFVTPAAVSQQIKTLETYLGVALFRRLPRALELSEQGLAMLPKVREGLDCLVAAVEFARVRPDALLTVHAPPSFALRWLVPRLSRFGALHPDVKLRLASDVGNIDGVGRGPESLFVDLRDAGDAVAVRFGVNDYPGFRRDVLLAPEYVLVCSPDLLTRIGPLKTPADLRDQTLIHDESIPDESVRPSWAEWFRLAGVPDVDVSRGPRFSSAVWASRTWMSVAGRASRARFWCWRRLWAGRGLPWRSGHKSKPMWRRGVWSCPSPRRCRRGTSIAL